MTCLLASVKAASLGPLRSVLGEEALAATPHAGDELDDEVKRVQLVSPGGEIVVTVCNLGATIESIVLRDRGEMLFQPGDWAPRAEGYNGRTVGPLAGRTRNYAVSARNDESEEAQLKSNLDEQDMARLLHGGRVGFSHRVWRLANTFCSQTSARAVFELESHHMEQGHPGRIRVEAHISAVFEATTRSARCDVRYRARLHEASPSHALINLTSHCYFNLGQASCLDLELHMPSADRYFPEFLSTKTETCAGQFDFKEKRRIGGPLDHYFLYSGKPLEGEQVTRATLESPERKVKLTITSTCPGVQVYTGQHCGHRGVCLEFQYPPVVSDLPAFLPRTTLEGKLVALDRHPSRNLALGRSPRRGSSNLSNVYEYDELTVHEFSDNEPT